MSASSSHVLHTVVVSYNRLELLKRTLESYRETVTLPHTLAVVDNGSTLDVVQWLKNNVECAVYLPDNRYPGFAANLGFGLVPTATLLHRSDNDMEYKPGWCEEVLERFRDPHVGMVGLRTAEEENNALNLGGNAVIRREVWEAGARYDERPWQEMPWEDGAMSQMVKMLGYRWERVSVPCTEHIGIASSDDPYYQQTFHDRGITFAEWGVA